MERMVLDCLLLIAFLITTKMKIYGKLNDYIHCLDFQNISCSSEYSKMWENVIEQPRLVYSIFCFCSVAFLGTIGC